MCHLDSFWRNCVLIERLWLRLASRSARGARARLHYRSVDQLPPGEDNVLIRKLLHRCMQTIMTLRYMLTRLSTCISRAALRLRTWSPVGKRALAKLLITASPNDRCSSQAANLVEEKQRNLNGV